MDGYTNENVLDILTNLSTKKLTPNFEVKYYAGGRIKMLSIEKPKQFAFYTVAIKTACGESQ